MGGSKSGQKRFDLIAIRGVVFDVDGVLASTPHEESWRAALRELTCGILGGDETPALRFTHHFYQAHVAGKSREEGARVALARLGLPGGEQAVSLLCRLKHDIYVTMLAAGKIRPYTDALRLLEFCLVSGKRVAVVSASRNADQVLRSISAPGTEEPKSAYSSLAAVFHSNLCGSFPPQGKAHLFDRAACDLGVDPSECLVVEDAPAGLIAAKQAGMLSLGVARHREQALLAAAGADLVVATLDELLRPVLEPTKGPLSREVVADGVES